MDSVVEVCCERVESASRAGLLARGDFSAESWTASSLITVRLFVLLSY